MKRSTALTILALLVMALAYPLERAWAQVVYGSIIGTVEDSSGAAVPGAKVTVTNVGQGVSFTTTSNESGNYQQTHLIPGTYSVKVEKEGFQSFLQQNVTVAADVATQVNATLKVGAVTQEVTVTAAVPLLKTEKTDVSTSFSERQVVDLPILNRQFTQFELLTPGTARLPWQHAASEVPQGDIQIMVNGQHFSGTGYLLDGTDNQDPILGIAVIKPNLDAVTELKMTTQDYDAEFSDATAGVVSAQTKSGTNDLHGSAFWFRRTGATTARDPFAQSQVIPGSGGRFIPPSKWNDIGGSLGGPIKKDKTFFFGDYEGTWRTLGGSVLTRVPTSAELLGDFSALAAKSGSDIFNPYSVPTDPTSPLISNTARSQFVSTNVPGPTFNAACASASCPNMIPTALLSPQALAIAKFFPLPNLAQSDPTQPNYSASGNQTFNNYGFDVRIDQYQTEKLHYFGRYSLQKFNRSGPGAFGLEAGGPALNVDPSVGGFAGTSDVLNHSLASGFDYTLNSTWLTDFRFGFMRYRVFVNPNGLGTSPATDAGIPDLNLDKTFTSGMPSFFINGPGTNNSNLGYGLGVNQCNCPLNEQEMEVQFVNNWTHMMGNHTFKWGVDYRHAWNLRVPSDTHRAGELSFNSSTTGGPSGGGLGWATFLLGDVSNFGRYVSQITDAAERQNRLFFYGEDTYRFTPKLTLNYGLRWENYFPQYVNGAGKGGWVQYSTGEVWVAGAKGIGLNGNVQNSYTMFAPRLGIAYQINPKTVLRMGYGRSFNLGTFGSLFGHTVTQNLPILANEQLSPSASWNDVFTLANGPGVFDVANALTNNCVTPSGAPNPITNPTGTNTTCLGSTGNPLLPDGVNPHMHPSWQRVPTVDAWNVTVQHAFTNSLSAEVGYVANKGTHYWVGDGPNYNLNDPTMAGYFTASLPGCPAPCTNARKPYYLLYGWTQGINYYGNDASNQYESLQAKVEKRFSQNYSIMAHYTFAHAYQYQNDYYAVDHNVVWGPSDFQRNQVFVLTHMVQLPFGKGQKFMGNAGRALDLVVGGWQFNGAWTISSGLPFTPSYSECGADEDTSVCMPIRVGNTTPSNPNQHQWYIPASSALSTNGATSGPWKRPDAGTLGTAGFGSMRGPGFWNADLSLFKNFKVTEKVTGQFRAESFNALNHANLGNPDGCVDCGSGGVINGLIGGAFMRQWQFALRFDF